MVKKCDDGTIALGYNHLDFLQQGNVACGGRKRSEEWQFIEVSFIPSILKTTTALSNGLWLFLIAAGFLGIWLYKRTPTVDPSPTTTTNTNTNTEPETLGWINLGNSKFDLVNQILICGDSKQSLTFREAKLLSLFVTNVNKVLEREYIIQQVWADEGVLVGRSVDVFVSRLRRIAADVIEGRGGIIDSEPEVGGYPVYAETRQAFVEADWDLATMEPKKELSRRPPPK